MTVLTIVRVVSLFLLVWFGFVNIGKLFRGHPISTLNLIVMSAALVAFVASYGLLGEIG